MAKLCGVHIFVSFYDVLCEPVINLLSVFNKPLNHLFSDFSSEVTEIIEQ